MEILEVYPKEWHIKFELTADQLLKLVDFLDNCVYQLDPKDERNVSVRDYVIGDFFPKLDRVAEELTKQR